MKRLMLGLVALVSLSTSASEFWPGFKASCVDHQNKVVASVVNDKLFLRGGLNGFFPKENLVGKMERIRSGRMVEDMRGEQPIEAVAAAYDHYGTPHEITVFFDRPNQTVRILDQSYRPGGIIKVNLFQVVVQCAKLTYVN